MVLIKQYSVRIERQISLRRKMKLTLRPVPETLLKIKNRTVNIFKGKNETNATSRSGDVAGNGVSKFTAEQ